jgi:hypothetical protein
MKDTFFAPANRATDEKINADFDQISHSEYIRTVINALPEVVAILNKERQIVFGNDALLNFLGIIDEKDFLGLRSGEALQCINSGLTPGGCGTSEKCRYCGSVNAILDSQRINQKVTKECRIISKVSDKHEFLNLLVTSAPFNFQDNTYSILSIEDISDVKRRAMLERIFFHDVINIAGGLKGVTDILIEPENTLPGKENEYLKLVNKMSKELLEEIMSQRALTFAENGELQPNFTTVSTSHILKETISYLSHHAVSLNKNILINEHALNATVSTDEVLLKRVLINMLKNALEASPKGAAVLLNCKDEGDFVSFTVHNQGFMPPKIQAQVFQRSFSTRGADRGLGTYSIKLLTSRYLKGTTGFTSSIEEGTEFFVKIPFN